MELLLAFCYHKGQKNPASPYSIRLAGEAQLLVFYGCGLFPVFSFNYLSVLLLFDMCGVFDAFSQTGISKKHQN